MRAGKTDNRKELELSKVSLQRVKIVEKNGSKLEHLITKPDPFGDPKCERGDCLLCQTSEKETGRCRKVQEGECSLQDYLHKV